MFDYNKMIQRAVQFFPTWSDIRKRYKVSTGGKLIGSTLEEICELEEAIKEYKQYYFLDNYEGHEDDVIAFVYKFAIGNIDIKTLLVEYNDMPFHSTEKAINDFLFNDNEHEVLLIDIREPEEIDKVVEILKEV